MKGSQWLAGGRVPAHHPHARTRGRDRRGTDLREQSWTSSQCWRGFYPSACSPQLATQKHTHIQLDYFTVHPVQYLSIYLLPHFCLCNWAWSALVCCISDITTSPWDKMCYYYCYYLPHQRWWQVMFLPT